ncbi:MAG: alpha/beta hydrolase [Actinomycetota bacterium]|nr:alpha/beta hydrolase [Actinomycetota bacterium]
MVTATVSGTRVHFVDAGSGSIPLVLLHAFPLHSGQWDDQVGAFSPRRRVVAPDLPGFGSTPPIVGADGATMAGFADVVAGLIDQLGIGPVVLGGLSMGGYIAFALLRRRPDLVAGVVLADTRAGADSPEVAERRGAQQAQVADRGTAELIETMVGNLLSDETRAQRPEVVERVRALMTANPADGIIAALGAMRARPDSRAELATIRVPVLVVVGEHDGPSPPAEAEALADALPDAHLEVIEGAGHLSNLEAPASFNGVLATFLNRF